MEIRKVHVSLLNPAAYNPRKDLQPGDTQYDSLQRSITEFGYIDPIVWNERTGNVVGGHQRLKILTDRGDNEIDVSVVDLDEAREKALNLALNKISGEWDEEKLTIVLSELSVDDLIDLTGFDTVEVAELLSSVTAYSYIDDLMQESFAAVPGAVDKDTFEVTLTFEIRHKQKLDAFIKENGRDALVVIILEHIAEDGERCA